MKSMMLKSTYLQHSFNFLWHRCADSLGRNNGQHFKTVINELSVAKHAFPTRFSSKSSYSRNKTPQAVSTDHEESTNGIPMEERMDSTPCHIMLDDSFSSEFDESLVTDLRSHFDERFENPLETRSDRFCWDYWHVPYQYSLLRTPANAFFPPTLYDRLEDALCEWGERMLGCRGVSPVWLSYYIDGCHQELHTDAPHGPWAFVLSITDLEERCFKGGETVILEPTVLDYWRHFDPSQGIEMQQLVTSIEPHFGRLTVFDPRLPHGVRRVEGTRNPREARIVLHGWFTAPTPFFTGNLSEELASPHLNKKLDEIYSCLSEIDVFGTGTLTVRLDINKIGETEEVNILTNTIMIRPQTADDHEQAREELVDLILDNLKTLKFPSSAIETDSDTKKQNIISSDSTEVIANIVLPFIFE